MKFSEFAMFPSIKGKAKITAKIPVVHIAIFCSCFLCPKSFLERKKNVIVASMPKIRDKSLA